MSHVKCILDTHEDNKGKTWCGKPALPFDFHFMSIDHAALNGRTEGRLTVCPQCRKAVIAGLRNQEVQP